MKICKECKYESENSNFCIECGSEMVDAQELCEQQSNALNKNDIEKIDMVSNIWPDWKVVKEIGSGSFGKVYEVVREVSGSPELAAVKVISVPRNMEELKEIQNEGRDEAASRSYFEGIVNDFENEVKMMVIMKGGSANIVNIEDHRVVEKKDTIGWDIFIRMERLTPLEEYVAINNIKEDDVIKLGIEVCTALELCLKKGIIHRDITPKNLFVSDNFNIFKIGDFGVARELGKTSKGLSIKGTPEYMAPEIWKTGNYDETVDIYSLGLVLYKLLNNNRLPFIDPYAQLIQPIERERAYNRRINGEPITDPVNASPKMALIIRKACAIDPKLRFRSASEMMTALENINADYVISPDKPKRLITSILAVTTALLLCASIALGIYIYINFGKIGEPIAPPATGPGQETSNSTYTPKEENPIEQIDTSENVIDALENSKYDDALNYAKTADEDILRVLLENRVDSLLLDFQKRKVKEENIIEEFDIIEQMQLNELNTLLIEKRSFISRIGASQLSFDTAERLFTNEEYVEAITHYGKVDRDDIDFINAQQGITNATNAFRDSVMSISDEYAGEEKYAEALNTLTNAQKTLSNDSDIESRVIMYTNSYRDKLLNDAVHVFNNDGYTAAIQILNTGLQILRNDTDLLNAIKDYELYTPIALDTIEIWQIESGGIGPLSNRIFTDNLDNTYAVFYTNTYRNNSFNIYRFDGNYERFTGRFVLDKRENSTSSDRIIKIYGDDVLLHSEIMSGGIDPIDFSVNISGVNIMKITIEGSSGTTALVNANIYKK